MGGLGQLPVAEVLNFKIMATVNLKAFVGYFGNTHAECGTNFGEI